MFDAFIFIILRESMGLEKVLFLAFVESTDSESFIFVYFYALPAASVTWDG